MVALASFLIVVAISLLVERIGTVALTLTGLSRDAARFQARSAFTGTGFTTQESEQVVLHPVRRRILEALMLVRSVGVLTAASSLVLSFLDTSGGEDQARRAGLLLLGVLVLGLAAASPTVDGHLSRLIAWALRRWTDIDARDYVALLGLSGGHAVMEITADPGDWLVGKRLDELDLPEEGVLVLAIRRLNGSFVGAPQGRMEIRPGDTLVVYGRSERLAELDERRAGSGGDQAHEHAVLSQGLVHADQAWHDRGRHAALETSDARVRAGSAR
jgi:NhaP-type Na+/H+ and K+/H+ antiporter